MMKMKAAGITGMSVNKGLLLNQRMRAHSAVEVIHAETSLFTPPDEEECLKSVCFQV